jgi:hypothetical protein
MVAELLGCRTHPPRAPHSVRAHNGSAIKPEEALLREPFPAPIVSQSEHGGLTSADAETALHFVPQRVVKGHCARMHKHHNIAFEPS